MKYYFNDLIGSKDSVEESKREVSIWSDLKPLYASEVTGEAISDRVGCFTAPEI